MILLFHSLQNIAQYKISRLVILDVGFRQFLASNHTLFGGGGGQGGDRPPLGGLVSGSVNPFLAKTDV